MRAVEIREGEGKMEGKCRPSTVQWRLQSEVEDCDWWKEQHLFISFIHLNSCESHECSSLLQRSNRAGSAEQKFNRKKDLMTGKPGVIAASFMLFVRV